MPHKTLILGGTAEARQVATALAARGDCEVVLSLAGRTEHPAAQGVPVRVGGFGGVGLAGYLKENAVDLLVDATHPYAARISANAAEAARIARVPILALRRPDWERMEGDRWTEVGDVTGAVRALGAAPRQVFSPSFRQEIHAFEAAPQHHYLVRSVDPVDHALPCQISKPSCRAGRSRPPTNWRCWTATASTRSCRRTAAVPRPTARSPRRGLGIEVIMVRRPALPDVPSAETVHELVAKVVHLLGPVAERGV